MRNSISLRRGASTVALGFALTAMLSGTAMAQDGAAAPADEAASDSDIVVTGYSASLQSAVNAKKNRDQVVESISAEDIGKPFELDFDPRLCAGLLDDLAQRPRANLDRRQSGGRV
jgi:hypothetical protein